jgi:hypothetical protein
MHREQRIVDVSVVVLKSEKTYRMIEEARIQKAKFRSRNRRMRVGHSDF